MRTPALPEGQRLDWSRDARLFLAAQLLDAVALGLSLVAVPWLLLDRGVSVGVAGSAYVATLAPYLVFGFAAGVVGDRVGRRWVMYVSHAAQAAFAALIPVWAIWGPPPVAAIFVGALGVGSARVFADAGAFGALEAIVGAQRFSRGQAVLGAAWAVGFFAGPAAAGALIPVIGPAATLGLEAATLVFAALAIRAVRTPFALLDGVVPVGILASVREGLAVIWRDATIRLYTALGAVWMAATAGAQALVVPLLRKAIGLSALETGFVFAAGALMGLAAAPMLAALERRTTPGRVTALTMAISAAAIAVLAASAAFGPALVALMAFELAGAVLAAVLIGERQRRVASSLQARVGMSGRIAVLTGATVGAALASIASGAVGLRAAYAAMAVAGGLVTAAAVVLVGRAKAPIADDTASAAETV